LCVTPTFMHWVGWICVTRHLGEGFYALSCIEGFYALSWLNLHDEAPWWRILCIELHWRVLCIELAESAWRCHKVLRVFLL
jgi:hypothetical protein